MRLNKNNKRNVDVKPAHIGNIIVFCEGETEFNYINYFKSYIETKDEYSNIKIIPQKSIR